MLWTVQVAKPPNPGFVLRSSLLLPVAIRTIGSLVRPLALRPVESWTVAGAHWFERFSVPVQIWTVRAAGWQPLLLRRGVKLDTSRLGAFLAPSGRRWKAGHFGLSSRSDSFPQAAARTFWWHGLQRRLKQASSGRLDSWRWMNGRIRGQSGRFRCRAGQLARPIFP